MRWHEVSIKTSHEAVDFLTVIFSDLGTAGVSVDDPKLVNDYIDSGLWDYTDLPRSEETSVVTVKAYLPDDEELEGKLASFEKSFDELGEKIDTSPASVTHEKIDDEDWANNWKKYFHVSHIGKSLVICPSWEEYTPEENETVITLDPGAAFGTGTHPTTSMCLAELEDLITSETSVFDVGTGSGVLSIAAAKLGASKITAVDYDATAVKAAGENIAMNGLTDKIDLKQSDLWQNVSGRADLVTANIIADIIIRLLPGLDEHLNAGGKLLASGIIEAREQDVINAAKEYGFVVEKTKREKEWVMLLISRGNGR